MSKLYNIIIHFCIILVLIGCTNVNSARSARVEWPYAIPCDYMDSLPKLELGAHWQCTIYPGNNCSCIPVNPDRNFDQNFFRTR